MLSFWFPAWLIFRSWRWRRYFLLNYLLTFEGLQGDIFQKIEPFITAGVRTTNPTIFQLIVYEFSYGRFMIWNLTKKTPWPEPASELYRQSDRRLSAKVVPTFADRECHVVNVTDPYGLILGFLDRSRYLSFEVAPQLYSRGWVDPVMECDIVVD
jgi:hypothetical protein